jgi:hypothetical protein
MFVKLTHSGTRSYVQLVEAYRDDSGRPKQRTVATLGRLDQLSGELESVVTGLLRVTGKARPAQATAPSVSFESARDLGDVWALTELWNSLGFDRLRRVFGRTRHGIDVEALLRLMVLNRLCDPEAKLGALRWAQTVSLPGEFAPLGHQHLLRAMDALVDHHDQVEQVLAGLLRPMVDQDLAVVFYDMTTIGAAGLSEQDGDVRKFGMSKEGLVSRQVMLGVVQTAEGLPLYHEVFDGNTAEVHTLKPTLEKIVQRFALKRVIAVADRGLLSVDNLADLQTIALPGGGKLEFILAVPGRRYSEFVELLRPLQTQQFAQATQEQVAQCQWSGLRLIVAHDPQAAALASARRDGLMQTLAQQGRAVGGQAGGPRRWPRGPGPQAVRRWRAGSSISRSAPSAHGAHRARGPQGRAVQLRDR